MRILILGDIHSNLEAFQAVLQRAEDRGDFDKVWCLGDTVGYGPDPGPCLDLLRQYNPVNIAGNHDHAAVGLVGLDAFNPLAASACQWTARNLSEEQKAYLKSLPLTHTEGSFTLAHGSLRDPLWEYLVNPEAASATFLLLKTLRCLVSHSHVPFLCQENQGSPTFYQLPGSAPVALEDHRVILNPGSVGQPRDGDPRASFVLYDEDTNSIVLHRVDYPIAVTQQKMLHIGLPAELALRLEYGR